MPFFSRSSETPVVEAWLCSVWIILPLCAPAVMLMQSEQAHHSPNITAEPIIKNVLSPQGSCAEVFHTDQSVPGKPPPITDAASFPSTLVVI